MEVLLDLLLVAVMVEREQLVQHIIPRLREIVNRTPCRVS
jgi:hypothetical protein